MNGVDQLKPLLNKQIRVMHACAIVADRDDRARTFAEVWEGDWATQVPHSADDRARQRRVGVDKADRLAFSRGAEDVQHDLPMSAGADDENVHHKLRWEIRMTNDEIRINSQ